MNYFIFPLTIFTAGVALITIFIVCKSSCEALRVSQGRMVQVQGRDTLSQEQVWVMKKVIKAVTNIAEDIKQNAGIDIAAFAIDPVSVAKGQPLR